MTVPCIYRADNHQSRPNLTVYLLAGGIKW